MVYYFLNDDNASISKYTYLVLSCYQTIILFSPLKLGML